MLKPFAIDCQLVLVLGESEEVDIANALFLILQPAQPINVTLLSTWTSRIHQGGQP